MPLYYAIRQILSSATELTTTLQNTASENAEAPVLSGGREPLDVGSIGDVVGVSQPDWISCAGSPCALALRASGPSSVQSCVSWLPLAARSVRPRQARHRQLSMELVGLEPTTSTLPASRSPS